jgi:hypothetical protein
MWNTIVGIRDRAPAGKTAEHVDQHIDAPELRRHGVGQLSRGVRIRQLRRKPGELRMREIGVSDGSGCARDRVARRQKRLRDAGSQPALRSGDQYRSFH